MPAEMEIYQIKQIREFENLAKKHFDISSEILMQRAGQAALECLLTRWPQTKKIAIFCGNGNNGGDGYVLAHLAHTKGLEVNIWQVGDSSRLKPSAKKAYQVCCSTNIKISLTHKEINLQDVDVIVDAICGIGLTTDLRPSVLSSIEKINHSHLPILAIDIPTGVNADTGYVSTQAILATTTITFLGLKLGLLTGNGKSHAGEVVLNDLQIPKELHDMVKPCATKINFHDYLNYFKPRPRDWHKGLSGHVLVIGGAPGFSGAPRMAAMAALRVGAGLASVAMHPDQSEPIHSDYPELMCHAITHVEDLLPLISKASVLVLGPGLQKTEWSKEIWEIVCQQNLPLVLDADGLNLLSVTQEKFTTKNWILTPHPAEAARLLQTTTSLIQQDRLHAVQSLAKKYQCIAVLKGAGSLVQVPGERTVLCDRGNPGMSTAGMGDILSGIIAGLMAQKIPANDAAKLGVYIHAWAGDLAAAEAGERGMIATDLLPYLRQIVNSNDHRTIFSE